MKKTLGKCGSVHMGERKLVDCSFLEVVIYSEITSIILFLGGVFRFFLL